MKILIADKYPESHLERFKQLGCTVTYNPTVKAEELPGLIAGHKVLIVRSKKVTGDTLKAADQLAMVLRAGAGVNTIDVKTASSLGIAVTNCPGKNSIAVAELVFALLLAIDRRVVENTNSLRAHKWNKKEFSKADGVFGKTIGIIGVGSIGVEVAKRAQAFGMKVIGFDPFLTAERAKTLGIEIATDVDDIFRRGDVVTLHTDLRPETRKMVNAARLALMKPNAIFLNAARGEVVDQAALLAALQAKKIRAGLDVFDPEPADATADFNDAILDQPNMIGTHHIGASTDQAQDAIGQEAFRMVEAFIQKGEILNCVNKDAVKPKACAV